MSKSTINLHTIATTRARETHQALTEARERGSITVEHVMWAVVIVALVTAVGALLTTWATGKIGELG